MTKIDNLKKNIKTTAIRLGTISGIALFLFLGAFFYGDSTKGELEELEKRKRSMISNQAIQKSKYNKALENLEKFLKIEKNDLPNEQDFKVSYARLKPLIENMEILKKNYHFKTLDFSMGEIKENKSYSSSKFKLYENLVTLNFKGAPEHFIYSFLEDLKGLLPGFLVVEKFEMRRNSLVQPFLVERFLKDKEFHFTSGKIELRWLIMQDSK